MDEIVGIPPNWQHFLFVDVGCDLFFDVGCDGSSHLDHDCFSDMLL